MFNVMYQHKARVTKYIIYICVALYIVTMFNPNFFYAKFSLFPPDPTFPGFVMHAFMHGGLIHLAFNMFALYQVGTILELTLGERRFLLLYAVLLVLTATLTILFGQAAYHLGASGVIMGLFAYLYATLPKQNQFIKQQLGALLLINIMIGFLPGISLIGHFGGAVVGFIIGKSKLFQTWRFR